MKKACFILSVVLCTTTIVSCNKEDITGDDEREKYHEYVDLGLSVKWATCNIGANKPEEYGKYFAWGEISGEQYKPGKRSGYSTFYGWGEYKYCYGGGYNITKYCVDAEYGIVDNDSVLELIDDAASANWGGNWRMPTQEEIYELVDSCLCTWTWIKYNGVYGYNVISKVPGYEGNSIFLPAAGYRTDDELSSVGTRGYYWSSSLYTDFSEYAYDIGFGAGYFDWDYDSRYYGQSVRPVCP